MGSGFGEPGGTPPPRIPRRIHRADTFLKLNSRIAVKLQLPLLRYYYDVFNVNDSGFKLSPPIIEF